MPLRITRPDGESVVDVTGTDGRPAPVGYLDAEGHFHRQRPTLGDSEALYTQRAVDRLLDLLQKAETEARYWNKEWR